MLMNNLEEKIRFFVSSGLLKQVKAIHIISSKVQLWKVAYLQEQHEEHALIFTHHYKKEYPKYVQPHNYTAGSTSPPVSRIQASILFATAYIIIDESASLK